MSFSPAAETDSDLARAATLKHYRSIRAQIQHHLLNAPEFVTEAHWERCAREIDYRYVGPNAPSPVSSYINLLGGGTPMRRSQRSPVVSRDLRSVRWPDASLRRVKGIDAVRSIGLKWRTDLDGEILTAILDASSSIEFAPHAYHDGSR